MVSNVYIRLEKGTGEMQWLAYATPNDGTFSWQVPYGQTPASDYRVGIYFYNGVTWPGDTSDATFTIAPGDSTTVTAPNGGETWQRGTLHDITWTSTGTVGSVYLRLEKGGAEDHWIACNIPNTGSYTWQIPYNQTPDSDYRVGVYFFNGVTWLGDTSDADFTVGPGDSTTVTSPNGGESWASGTQHNITWTSTGTVGSVYLRLEKGGVPQYWIACGIANTGSYTWRVPYTQAAGTNYRIGVYFHNGVTWLGDTSDADMAITVGDSVRVTSPNAAEYWAPGTQHAITWTSTGSVSNVYIRLEKGGAEDHWIVCNTANTGSYLWTVPNDQAYGTDYRIGIYFYTGSAWPGDTSDADFTIPQGSLTLTAPNGGETWTAGTQHNITWDVDGGRSATCICASRREAPKIIGSCATPPTMGPTCGPSPPGRPPERITASGSTISPASPGSAIPATGILRSTDRSNVTAEEATPPAACGVSSCTCQANGQDTINAARDCCIGRTRIAGRRRHVPFWLRVNSTRPRRIVLVDREDG